MKHLRVGSSCTFGKPESDIACTQKYNVEAGNSILRIGGAREYNANFHECNYGVLEDWPQLGQLIAPEPAQLEVDRSNDLGIAHCRDSWSLRQW